MIRHQPQFPSATPGRKGALIIVNGEYDKNTDYEDLKNPKLDGEIMKTIFENAKFDPKLVRLISNCNTIAEEIEKYINDIQNFGKLDLFHFHYSGHGVHNAKAAAPMDNYRRTLAEGYFQTRQHH